jgi:hypothetical protein
MKATPILDVSTKSLEAEVSLSLLSSNLSFKSDDSLEFDPSLEEKSLLDMSTASSLNFSQALVQADTSLVYDPSIESTISQELVQKSFEENTLLDLTTTIDWKLVDPVHGKLADTIRKKRTPKERRPLLSLFSWTTKQNAEEIIGTVFTSYEWALANEHAKYPGAGEPVKDMKFYARRLQDKAVDEFIEWLYAADLLQNVAYGFKVIKYSNGHFVTIESVKRKQCIRNIVRQYTDTWRQASEELEIPQRCNRICSKSNLRCMKSGTHQGKCHFTLDSKLSPSTVENILKQITSGDIKTFKGLDNIYVEKGNDSFENMKAVLQNICLMGNLGSEEEIKSQKILEEKINEVAEFHKVGFPRHLRCEDSRYICCCMECAFCEPGGLSKCKQNHSHGICLECKDSFNIFADLLKIHSKAMIKYEESGHLEKDLGLYDDLISLGEEIKQGLRNLYDYRRHIAHKVDEAAFDAQYYSNLKSDECVVIADYKMKILAMRHKEPQSDWFSKRGFSCLGFLIMFGSNEQEKDEYKVLYHLFISNDTTQDAAAVNCAKAYLYKVVLPTYGIKKVHYRCDGAGNFSGNEAKAAIALWPELGGVTEISYKTSVSGDGKSNLDGLFGVLTRHLHVLVDGGASFRNAEELCELLVLNPLKHTEIHHFLPKREQMNWAYLPQAVADKYSLSNRYLVENIGGVIYSRAHSRHGQKQNWKILHTMRVFCLA